MRASLSKIQPCFPYKLPLQGASDYAVPHSKTVFHKGKIGMQLRLFSSKGLIGKGCKGLEKIIKAQCFLKLSIIRIDVGPATNKVGDARSFLKHDLAGSQRAWSAGT